MRMIEQFVSAGVKGVTPVFLLFSAIGMAGGWRLWRTLDRQVLFVTALPLLAAIWIHLWWARETCPRYFFPLAILMSPCAAMGLDGLSRWLAASWRSRGWEYRAAAAMPAILAAVVGLTVSLGSDCRFRTATVELGRWANRELGPAPLTFGPDGVAQVVNYYAQGRCQSFPAREADSAVAARVESLRPDLVLLPADRKTVDGDLPLVERIERLGFVEVDRSEFSGGCRKVLVLRRASAAAHGAPLEPPGQGRRTVGQARMPESHAWMAISNYCGCPR
jgi:hypothetical protein